MRPLLPVVVSIVLLSCGLAARAFQQSGLLVGFRVDEYFSDTYTAKSREDFVFFSGEPIRFRVVVRNMGQTDTALVVPGPDPKQILQIQGFRAVALPPDSTRERRWYRDRFDDEEVFSLPITRISPTVRVFDGGAFNVQLEPRTVVPAGESLEWVLSVSSEALQPGHFYRFVVKVNGTDDRQKPLLDYANIRFEVRPRTSEAQPEILRREALRRFFNDDFGAAREAVADLLRVHPNSAEAYRTLELIAEREGRRDEVLKHRATVNEIITNRRDALLLKYQPPPRLPR